MRLVQLAQFRRDGRPEWLFVCSKEGADANEAHYVEDVEAYAALAAGARREMPQVERFGRLEADPWPWATLQAAQQAAAAAAAAAGPAGGRVHPCRHMKRKQWAAKTSPLTWSSL
jgi:hypothetical protein